MGQAEFKRVLQEKQHVNQGNRVNDLPKSTATSQKVFPTILWAQWPKGAVSTGAGRGAGGRNQLGGPLTDAREAAVSSSRGEDGLEALGGGGGRLEVGHRWRKHGVKMGH